MGSGPPWALVWGEQGLPLSRGQSQAWGGRREGLAAGGGGGYGGAEEGPAWKLCPSELCWGAHLW